MLRLKFGAISEEVVRTIEGASEEAVDRWTAGVREAASLEALLRTQ
jgi:hypothetical protein